MKKNEKNKVYSKLNLILQKTIHFHFLVETKIKQIEEKFKYEKETTENFMKMQQEEYQNKIKELEVRMVQVI